MIAEVVVDIKNKAVDKVFDYEIPTSLASIVQEGSRVLVPFGPRTISGFVLNIKSSSEHERLRKINAVLDIEPVLNEEMRCLGISLAKQTGSTMIQCFEAMIPNAMRSTYKKKILLSTETPSIKLQTIFKNATEIQYNDISLTDLPVIKEALLQKEVEILYEVKDKLGKKIVKYIKRCDDFEQRIETLNFSRAPKQLLVLNYLKTHSKDVEKSVLLQELGVSSSILKPLIEKKIIEEFEIEAYRDPFENISITQSQPHQLNDEQQFAVNSVIHSFQNCQNDVFLLHGITGSGKTEVYLQIIQDVIKQGKQAIMLVPEIALTPQIASRFKSRFQNNVAVLHSGLSMGEKYDEWRKILKGEVSIVVGARSAIFAPFKDIGVIIVDEEHEMTYKQEDAPRYHAIEVAKSRGENHHCPVVLGSATPSLESFARAKKGVYQLLNLTKRAVAVATLPQVELIDMKEMKNDSDSMILSQRLAEAIEDRLTKKEQIVLLLNRRGYSNFMQCRECGDVVTCGNCDVSLTYHKPNHMLKCHYCGFEMPIVRHCPTCHSDALRFFGQGTQKVEEYLEERFKGARVMRMDVDTTTKKGSHQQLITAFENHEADILLGTQMVGKGLDFKDVTLVGVLAADQALHISDFRAAERTFQLLTQVAGRAGRHDLAGEVLIQTFSPNHYALQCVVNHDYLTFYEKEMQMRKQFGYPPFYYLCSVSLSSEDYDALILACDKVNRYLRQYFGNQCIIVGPTMPYVGRVNQRFRMYFMIKYKVQPQLKSVLTQLLSYFQDGNVNLFIDYYPNYLN